MAEDRCPLKARVTERLDGREIQVDLPCALSHGHRGPCRAESAFLSRAERRRYEYNTRREEILSADEADQNIKDSGGF